MDRYIHSVRFRQCPGLPVVDVQIIARDVGLKEILDLLGLAVRYGCGSAEAFVRAFRVVHGAGPSDVRRESDLLRIEPILRFSLIVEGNVGTRRWWLRQFKADASVLG